MVLLQMVFNKEVIHCCVSGLLECFPFDRLIGKSFFDSSLGHNLANSGSHGDICTVKQTAHAELLVSVFVSSATFSGLLLPVIFADKGLTTFFSIHNCRIYAFSGGPRMLATRYYTHSSESTAVDLPL